MVPAEAPVGRRFIVWIIAMVASVELVAQAALALYHGLIVDGTALVVAAATIFGGIAFIEHFKSKGER